MAHSVDGMTLDAYMGLSYYERFLVHDELNAMHEAMDKKTENDDGDDGGASIRPKMLRR